MRRQLGALLGGGFLLVTSLGASAGAGQPTASPENSSSIRWASAKLSGPSPSATNNQGRVVPLGTDPDLQKHLERLLERARPIAGAATLVDARTGQVLAAAEIGNSPTGSLLFDSVAPAASVFKIVTTAAIYEHTSVTPTTPVCTEGGLREIAREHLTPSTGPNAICGKFGHALGTSRNAAYAQLATQKLLREQLVLTAEKLGFGSSLALDARGTMGKASFPYNDLSFARTAAGFENSTLSVFGGAQLAMIVASGGLLRPMHFQVGALPEAETRVISERTAKRLRHAMEVTIHSGTARESFLDARGHSTVGPVQVAGKTGTLKPSSEAATSSWFVGFAPSDNPRVVVSVLLQIPDQWVRKGHQLGRDLLQVYLMKIGVKGIRPE